LVDKQYNPSIRYVNTEEYKQGLDTSFNIPNNKITPRPNLDKFWEILFNLSDENVSFYFAIWSSSYRTTFDTILKTIIPEKYYPSKFLFVWDRNMCELDPDFGKNPKLEEHSTIKRIDTVLKNPVANRLRKWKCDDKEQNIIIVDNDEIKLRFNHPNSQLIFSAFDEDIMDILSHPFFELDVRK